MPYRSIEYLNSLSEEKLALLLSSHVPLGYHPTSGDVFLLSETDRYVGTYVIGKPGVGKTQFLLNGILHDLRTTQQALIVLDPHDLVDHIIERVDYDTLKRTYVLDMLDTSHPFGVNILANKGLDEVSITETFNRVMRVFEVIWPGVMDQQHLPNFLRAGTLTLLMNPGSTLVNMLGLFTDDAYRRKLVRNVTSPSVRNFWARYEDTSPRERDTHTLPLVNRLNALFMGRDIVTNILGQSENTIDFRKVIENKEVILIKLPLKKLEQEAKLIGTILMSQIHAAVFSFADTPEDKRPGVSLFIDEFANFVSRDIAELVTEGRKYGIKLTMAHQTRDQLPDYLESATLATRNKVVFQVIAPDSRELAHEFQNSQQNVKPEDLDDEPLKQLLKHCEHSLVEVFLREYVAKVEDKEILRLLNRLLYKVMRDGTSTLSIPPEIVLGFAHIGYDFHSAFLRSRHKAAILSGNAAFPPALVVRTPDGGSRFTRLPEHNGEQLYHFLYHLYATILWVEQNPIGKKTTTSNTEVASMLTQLPPRAAFIRAGDEIGVVYTHDTEEPIDDDVVISIVKEMVRDQTRAMYCRAKADIEQGHVTDINVGNNEPQAPGWEEE